MQPMLLNRAACCLALFCLFAVASAADWPTYRGDAARSGYTREQLPAKPSLAWQYQPAHGPQPAWPRDDRMYFDRAHDVVVAEDTLLFGSTVECRVVALDARTGRERWTFFTGGPVRFSPTVWKGRVFAVSDDGYLYCLNLQDGGLIRKWRGGPSDDMILGNGRMVSRWPARGGPAIVDGVVYWAAGIWQSDGVYLTAIDAQSGEVLWRNEDAAKIYMPQPHGGANAESGVTVQGHLVAAGETLLVPTGRAVPAAFHRQSGRFQYYHLQANGHTGGTHAVAAGESFYNGGSRFNVSSGALEGKLGAGPLAVTPQGVFHAAKNELRLVKLVEKTLPDRKGVPTKTLAHEAAWAVPDVDGSAALIVAGDTVIAGGSKTVTAVDAKARKVVWSAQVAGTPYSLAVAGGALYVSTDQGTIYRFDGTSQVQPSLVRQQVEAPAEDATLAAAAEEIVRRTEIRDGYCLDLDCSDIGLAIALAKRTNLHIYALHPSADEALVLRQQLQQAGLLGARINVHQGTADELPYGKYFADLVISSRSLAQGPLDIDPESPPLALRPSGGKVCTGKPGQMQVFTRTALAKTGSWTHQYSDLGNTGCSADEVVKGQLHALWFRDVDLEMPNRHGRGHAPLFEGGRMFVEGTAALRAVDAYNGRNLWEFALPGVQKSYSAEHLAGTAVTGSNFCLGAGSVYVHDKERCYRLGAATGKKLGEFPAPVQKDGQKGHWGYIACDGQRLLGSLANPEHKVRFAYGRSDMADLWGESTTLFALDAQSGKLLWRYDAKDSIRHNAIAVGSGRVYLIDRPLAKDDKWDPSSTAARLPAVAKVDHPPGQMLALDAATGKLLWKAKEPAFGTVLAYSQEHDALLMSYQSTRFKLPSEIGGRVAVFRGQNGEKLWEKQASYVTRPVINGATIYAQGGAWDLVSGDDRPFELKRSYGCGQIAASKNMMLFRSGTLGYLDLTRGSGVENFGGIRPGCWINALPVGGLVLVPDASAGCQCSYQNRSWMALAGDDD
jgi:outer membrane protein assembly factor BamB